MKIIKLIPIKPISELILNIEPAKNNVPEWYKKSPQKVKESGDSILQVTNPAVTSSTYKKCSPFLDALTNGYIFYLSSDIEVTKKEDGSPLILWRTSKYISPVSEHTKNQWEGLEYPKDCHDHVFKWDSYFVIKTPKNYSTLFTHPHNRFDLPFYTLSGVVDTDKYDQEILFPFFLKKDFTGVIKAGTPVAQMTFFKRHHWLRNVSKFNEEFIASSHNKYFSKIDRPYKNLIWQKKQYD
jgi:hypothetical protein